MPWGTYAWAPSEPFPRPSYRSLTADPPVPSVYVDSSPDAFDDPKVETIVEVLKRVWGSAWGAVSTAFLADATPIALTARESSAARGKTPSLPQYGFLGRWGVRLRVGC